MAKQWLKRLTVEQAEADNSGREPWAVRFHSVVKNTEWIRLVSKIKVGDQLYAHIRNRHHDTSGPSKIRSPVKVWRWSGTEMWSPKSQLAAGKGCFNHSRIHEHC